VTEGRYVPIRRRPPIEVLDEAWNELLPLLDRIAAERCSPAERAELLGLIGVIGTNIDALRRSRQP